ncbi:MAG: hypothetical protein M0017_00855 [Desulfobacteraceae bacterium]|nr:hypothetical protein [Desulfobacteraceae bacterium]
MTLFTKTDCRLCDQLKKKFDLGTMGVKVEVLDGNDAGALAHLAWHGLVEAARKSLPLLVLDDSSSVIEYAHIERHLVDRARKKGGGYRPRAAGAAPVCEGGSCSL